MSDALTDDHEGQLNGLDEILDPAHTALVVVDMQNDFCAENGYIHNAQGVDMSANKPLAARIGKMVEAAREIGVMVVWIKAIYDHDLLPAPMLTKMLAKGKGAVCCASGSWGADFYEIGPIDGEQVVEKRCYSRVPQHPDGRHPAPPRHKIAGDDRRRHQCLRREHAARGVLPRLLHRHAAGLRRQRQCLSA